MKLYLGVDLGGTNIAAGLVDETCRVIDRLSIKTNPPRPVEALCQDIAHLCRELAARAGIPLEQFHCVGVGSPGAIHDGKILFANNLGLRNAPLAAVLSRQLGLPAYLYNDGNAAAFGEYMAGQHCHSLVAVTLGTGIGGGLILDGRIWTGHNGAAAELGHMTLYPGGLPCSCGRSGCFEAYCSATALQRFTREAMGAHPESMMWELCDGDLENANAMTAFEGMRRQDEVAARILRVYINNLAAGISNMITLLQPEIICLGGGVAKEGENLLLPLRQKVRALTPTWQGQKSTSIVAAVLGNDAGIAGAAMLGKIAE